MKGTRKKHKPEFKAKVALEALFDGTEENLPQDDGELPAQTDDPALAN